MKDYSDYTGKKYHRLYIKNIFRENIYRVKARCVCDCGNEIITRLESILKGTTQSCGCYHKERASVRPTQNNIRKKFGRLVVLDIIRKIRNDGKTRPVAICKCDCGTIKNINLDALRQRKTSSCGCLNRETRIRLKTIHGKSEHPLYDILVSAKGRCHNIKNHAYKHYGARGIVVCEEWRKDFMAFYNWSMKNGYREGLELDRRDNDGPYSPDNCRWITHKEQMNNIRRNRLIEHKGEKKTLTQWAEFLEMSPSTLSSRIVDNSWSIERAMETPVRKSLP